MKHNLRISVSKEQRDAGVAACRTVDIRERLLRFLLGTKQKVTILIPGDCVEEVCICQAGEGGAAYE